MRKRKAAHFLLVPELLHSPPNHAIITSYLENDYQVDIYSPGALSQSNRYGEYVRLFNVEYSWSWILRNSLGFRWFSYNVISGTSEDPLLIVGLISTIYRKRSICLVDEIKSGSYRGDRSEIWKNLCKKAIRRSDLRIVNDESRTSLLKDYAELEKGQKVMVYPGSFYERPKRSTETRMRYRNHWGINQNEFVIGSSGGFNMTAGADWLLQYVKTNEEVCAVIQPLGVTPLSMYLLKHFECRGKMYIQEKRMDWDEAWESAQALDVGLCIYKNKAPQFQHMGVSSNRLCMFLAMGVPVIATRQKSFEFLEEYNCGKIVDNYEEFVNSIGYIREYSSIMRMNCERCFRDYIRPKERYDELSKYIYSKLRK